MPFRALLLALALVISSMAAAQDGAADDPGKKQQPSPEAGRCSPRGTPPGSKHRTPALILGVEAHDARRRRPGGSTTYQRWLDNRKVEEA